MYVPEEANWRVRVTLALTEIDRVRSFGIIQSDDDCYRAAGFVDGTQFWEIVLSEPMKALSFTALLARYFRDPMLSSCEMVTRMGLEEALCRARDGGEIWFIRNDQRPERGPSDLHRLYVEPRKAAEWLLSKPMRKHLVPDGLRYFIEKNVAGGSLANKTYSTGRPPVADWQAIGDVIQHQCKARGGLPSSEGEKGWRNKADVADFVRNILKDRKEQASDSTIRRRVDQTLKSLARKGFEQF